VAMRARWLSGSRAALVDGPVVTDGLLGLALLLMVAVQLGVGDLDAEATRFLLFAPAVTLPLAWRRRAPLVTVIVVGGAVGAQSLVTQPLPAFGEFLAVMLATYSVAAHAGRRDALWGLVAAGTAVSVQGLRDPAATSSFEFVYGVVYFGGAWLVGRVARRQRRHAVDLTQRAALLEREREEKARAAVAEERGRIARELHDVIAHCVSVIVIQAGAAEEIAERDPASARVALRSIRAVGNEALADMRRLLGILRANGDELALDPQPGIARLDELVAQAGAAGLTVHVRVTGEPAQLPAGVDLTAYRVVQEALTNVRKHAHTPRADVHLRYLTDAIELEITDEGAAHQSANGAGHGLAGMRERVALYGGVMAAAHRPGSGFAVSVRLPISASAR